MRHIADAIPKYEKRTIAGNKSPYMVKGVVYRVMEEPRGYEGEGLASWYGEKFHGNATSNGETYDMYAMTAAHKTLPIPSYVRVERTDTGASIVVRVNDRGPFAEGRVIDLSYAAAQKLGYLEQGTAPVRVSYIHVEQDQQKVEPEKTNAAQEPSPENSVSTLSEDGLFLQLAAFAQRESADAALERASAILDWPVGIDEQQASENEHVFRLQVGPLPDEITVEILRQALVEQGFAGAIKIVK